MIRLRFTTALNVSSNGVLLVDIKHLRGLF
jgi:hypothetical protein